MVLASHKCAVKNPGPLPGFQLALEDLKTWFFSSLGIVEVFDNFTGKSGKVWSQRKVRQNLIRQFHKASLKQFFLGIILLKINSKLRK